MMVSQYFNLVASFITIIVISIYIKEAKKIYGGVSLLPLLVWAIHTFIFYIVVLCTYCYPDLVVANTRNWGVLLRTQGMLSVLVMAIYKLMRLRVVVKK